MTVGYNSGEKNCFNDLKSICESKKLTIQASELARFSKDFHNFMKTDLFNELFLNCRSSIKTSNFLELSDASINLNYFFNLSQQRKKDMKYGEKR
jgi:hypothetical protein